MHTRCRAQKIRAPPTRRTHPSWSLQRLQRLLLRLPLGINLNLGFVGLHHRHLALSYLGGDAEPIHAAAFETLCNQWQGARAWHTQRFGEPRNNCFPVSRLFLAALQVCAPAPRHALKSAAQMTMLTFRTDSALCGAKGLLVCGSKTAAVCLYRKSGSTRRVGAGTKTVEWLGGCPITFYNVSSAACVVDRTRADDK